MNNKEKEQSAGYIGPSDITLADGVMTPEALLSMGRLSDPQLSPDGKRILYGVSYTSIAENRSCRNLFLCDIDGRNKVQLTRYAKSVSNARWSNDGKSIFFIQDGQMWKAPVNGNKLGKKEQMSDIPNGISEFKLSPDQSSVIFITTGPGPVKTPKDMDPALDKARAYTTEDLMYRHWDHWVTEIPRSFVSTTVNGMITMDNSFDILGDEPYELPTEPFGGAEQLDWAPDGRHIAYSCRKKTGKDYAFSTDTEIYIFDVLTGATTRIPMDGGYDTDPVWSHDGTKLAWISMARDGYEADQQRLMICDIAFGKTDEGQSADVDIKDIRQLCASLDRDVAAPVWTPDDKHIIFNALTEGLQALFLVDINTDAFVRITPDDWYYDFDSPFAYIAGGNTVNLLTSYASLNFPTELVSVRFNSDYSCSFERITRENEHIFTQLTDPKSESVWIETVDNQQMQAWVLYPPKFNPANKYPAIEIVLGGPQSSNSQGWSYRWCYRLMAEQGYIVIMPNRRGTTSSGQEWKEEISGDYIGLNMQDYLSAARYIKSKPYVDKLACVGASYGGYSSYYLSGIHNNTFDCFIAHAGIFDEAGLYYTTEEMWFPEWDNGGLGRGYLSGSPWSGYDEAERHYANSPLKNVDKWNKPILCIHGEKDYRIPYTQGMAAFNTAQMMGVPSKLVVFPDENHWILQPQNSLYWHRIVYDWLDQWMK
ncbi:MAG: S9 family peptidase [Bacteroidales bacterium]|nr:S9 family peptidase [Bacteroidales bacterium]